MVEAQQRTVVAVDGFEADPAIAFVLQ